jgi:hypothetical protein
MSSALFIVPPFLLNISLSPEPASGRQGEKDELRGSK